MLNHSGGAAAVTKLKAFLKGQAFEGVVVPRQRKFYLLIDKQLEHSAGVAAGDVVEVALEANSGAKA